jgi:putative transposase
VLFQGKFKSIFVGKEKYFSNLLNYIHLNPVDLIEPNWKEDGIKSWPKIRKSLKDYRWSSYQDYIGIKNFSSVISPEALNKYSGYTAQWMRADFEEIESLTFE